MSLFHQASMWLLRALLVWGLIEAGLALYETGLAHSASLTRLAGHRAAMTRLEAQADAREAEARAAGATLANVNAAAWPLTLTDTDTPADAAARALREMLLRLGAEAPVVDGVSADAQHGLFQVTLTARWREPIETSPRVLHELARVFPDLRVERLTLERSETNIGAEATFSTFVRAAPARPDQP